MATADEILATMAEEAAATDQMAEVCTIDRCTRAVTIPEALRIVGVETDKDVTRRVFRVLCSYRGTNLSTFRIRIHFMNANKEKDIYYVTDAAQDGEYLTFSWVISRKATKYKGKLQFIACMVCDGGTDEEREWNSTLGEFTVLEGLEVELTDGEEEQARDAITQLLAVIDARESEAVEAVRAAGAETIASIPKDYTALSEDLVSISQAVNMFDKTAVVDGYVNYESGAVNPLSGNKATDYIPVKPNSTIVLINFQTATSDSRGMAFYNSAKYYVGGIQYTSTGDIVFEVPNDVYYIRATIYATKVDYGCIVSKYDAKERACPSYTDLLVKTLCIGDSLTVGADYTSGEYGGNMKENYPYYLGKLTGNEVDYIATAGFSAKNWWDENQNNDFSAYDSAIIWLGTNEGLLNAGYVDLSTNTGCYGAIIKKLRADNPNIKIFLCKVKHSSGDAATTNSVISNFVQAYHTGVIDIPSSDLWDAENMAIYHPNNNVHFSKVGNHALANFIKSEMDKYIASNLSSFNDLILGHGA